MALSWSMDKVGTIARSVEDCALVFAAIHGADGLDPAAVDRPFRWPPRRDVRTLRVGYVHDLFEEDRGKSADKDEERDALREWRRIDLEVPKALRDLGIDPVPVDLKSAYPVVALALILSAEAAAAFDDLTRSGRDDLLERQTADAWPNVFRQGQLIPAVEYLRANRIRTLVMAEMERLLSDLDVVVAPSFGGDLLLRTNLTGHPAVVGPDGVRSKDGTPTSITFLGRLHAEAELLSVARAYQEATGFHLRRPRLG
jgi:Asp-tRNA(Asn)/Glu-tRNA(Gln) amidotransferase A subunit family amidase